MSILDAELASHLDRSLTETDDDVEAQFRLAMADTDEGFDDLEPGIDPDDEAAVQLLHVLGHLYSQHGETKRGIVMLLIAARLDPDNVRVWRTIAHAFLADRDPVRAIAVLDRLRQMNDSEHPAMDLLLARALWASGRRLEARRSFRDFLMRSTRP